MGFILLIFDSIDRESVVKMIQFKKMKDIIQVTNNRVNYYDVRRPNIQYRTKNSIFQVVKV